MKLVRWGESGAEKPGLIDAAGAIRDLSGVVRDIAGPFLAADTLANLRRIDAATLPEVPAGTRLGACVGQVRNFIAIGLNYADHAAETGSPIPAEPILFNKAPSCIVGPNDTVILPKGSAKTDWEVELAIVIGKRASYVHANEALDYVAGYCVCHDVSEREFQLERGGTWTKGKGCPTFGPLGPWLVTPDEVGDVQNLDMWLDVNGERMQTGSTRTMIFDVRQIVSYLSHFMLLEPGDVITTGTPPGVGMGMKPPRYLKSGDVVSLGIAGLGEQRQAVVAFDDWTAKVAAGEPTN
ncbi:MULTISPECIES: fumarylacetoacetate hydrolase family protein [Methylobacterium]|jgi:2,4-diketo-3-deoxy-L-fuconate hydrolase|uniref:2-hydroxyhepta-2,4-diene-1,7-dioate isomerase n=2 Tax=Methylobacterium TaxID=407 RepID=A0A0C6EWZ4_9HYPH|nr:MULTISPECIES: fumarylacetoacetate hydrolase family protein [Methylobacterium]MBZ6414112.1 fumarylacetoacetate hydrolase family protein [Methylobacterium sp.]MBK3397470.1 fumarylacetoacetate hydrolase family protein [Methylobacterium ajmalii]MBK3409070.1 fumarylacetoacetate hydrolase family protein [Methylobacterium ajmalii]MBK3423008.1 fumarylacetoacetate hydrolase family protein [Methylobacterium ajmalii]SFF62420.1 2-keto-4-pentenoate hydratase/2-oxohepta-3-ene-1,7-dioic acid hydratase (ca